MENLDFRFSTWKICEIYHEHIFHCKVEPNLRAQEFSILDFLKQNFTVSIFLTWARGTVRRLVTGKAGLRPTIVHYLRVFLKQTHVFTPWVDFFLAGC